MKRDVLLRLAMGWATIQSMVVTEPNRGTIVTAIEMQAQRDGDEYVINVQKICTSQADVSDYVDRNWRAVSRVPSLDCGLGWLTTDLNRTPGSDARSARFSHCSAGTQKHYSA
jgi:hypothetical protein